MEEDDGDGGKTQVVDADPGLENQQASQGQYTQLMQDMIFLGSQGDPSLQNMSYLELLGVGPSNQNEIMSDTQDAHHGVRLADGCDYADCIFEGKKSDIGLLDDNPWGVGFFENMAIEEVVCEEPQVAAPGTGSSQSANEEATVYASAESNDGNQIEMLSSEDIEDFFENERKKIECVHESSIEEDLKPCMGMKFSTKEEGQQFFNFYSSVVGFSVAVVNSYRTTSKKRNNEITKVVMQCNKHGRIAQVDREQLVPQRRSTVITKTGCKMEMRITEKNKVWEVTRLNLEHNHELSPNSRFFRSHKYMSPEEKDLIRTLKYTNTPTGKIVDILAYVRGGIGCLPYTKKMVSNYGTEINKELQNTDMMEVVEMFNKKQADSPGFYYSTRKFCYMLSIC